jgi:hypothetical protein
VEKHDAADAEAAAAAKSAPFASDSKTGNPAEVATSNGIADTTEEDMTGPIGDVEMNGVEKGTRPTAEYSELPADEGVASEGLTSVVECGIAVDADAPREQVPDAMVEA